MIAIGARKYYCLVDASEARESICNQHAKRANVLLICARSESIGINFSKVLVVSAQKKVLYAREARGIKISYCQLVRKILLVISQSANKALLVLLVNGL